MDTGHSRRLGHTRGRLKLVIDSRVRPMSGQTLMDSRGMSGLPPIATELRTSLEVRFVPKADTIDHRSKEKILCGL
jgi:hypothetical protein